MSEAVILVTEKREGRGSRKAEKLRRQGKVPGVLYGHKQEAMSFSVDHDLLMQVVKSGARVVDIQAGATAEKAQIMELQYDHLGKDVLHVDLKRVSADERIEVKVRVELKGIAPGAAKGVLDFQLHSMNIECPAISVPDALRVNIGELQVGQAIHIKEVPLPAGVVALDDPDLIVVQVTEPSAEPEPGTEEATAAEPEVIRKAKAEEEEE